MVGQKFSAADRPYTWGRKLEILCVKSFGFLNIKAKVKNRFHLGGSWPCSLITYSRPFINQMLVWLNLQQSEGVFDLWFCFVLGTLEGSPFAAHWARWFPCVTVKPTCLRLSVSQLRFMNTEHTHSLLQLVSQQLKYQGRQFSTLPELTQLISY